MISECGLFPRSTQRCPELPVNERSSSGELAVGSAHTSFRSLVARWYPPSVNAI